jgi:hypothetical protein
MNMYSSCYCQFSLGGSCTTLEERLKTKMNVCRAVFRKQSNEFEQDALIAPVLLLEFFVIGNFRPVVRSANSRVKIGLIHDLIKVRSMLLESERIWLCLGHHFSIFSLLYVLHKSDYM